MTGAMTETGVFTFRTQNLGDEMQSYAVLAYLDRVHTFLDRDRLPDFQSDADTQCVFNSWFLIGDDRRRPSERVQPIWYGFAGWKETLYGDWIPYLKEQSVIRGPIGCRDVYTTELLLDAGIDTHWTGCITLFLGQALSPSLPERQGILFVDVPTAAEKFIPSDIVKRAERFSNFAASDIVDKPLERWAAVAHLADRIATAELVVTRRLHVALPAAGFGTPVVAIPDPDISFARRRFSGFEDVIPVVYLDRVESGLKKIDWQHLHPPRIPARLKEGYFRLCETLRSAKPVGGPVNASALDVLGRRFQRLINASKLRERSRVRLRLKDRVFDVPVLFWSDRYIDIGLQGFPGLSKFDFIVQVSPGESQCWTSWGPLSDLVTAGD